jgi:hypothetical protein
MVSERTVEGRRGVVTAWRVVFCTLLLVLVAAAGEL